MLFSTNKFLYSVFCSAFYFLHSHSTLVSPLNILHYSVTPRFTLYSRVHTPHYTPHFILSTLHLELHILQPQPLSILHNLQQTLVLSSFVKVLYIMCSRVDGLDKVKNDQYLLLIVYILYTTLHKSIFIIEIIHQFSHIHVFFPHIYLFTYCVKRNDLICSMVQPKQPSTGQTMLFVSIESSGEL